MSFMGATSTSPTRGRSLITIDLWSARSVQKGVGVDVGIGVSPCMRLQELGAAAPVVLGFALAFEDVY